MTHLMKHFACVDETGRIVCAFSAPSLDDARSAAGGAALVELAVPALPSAQFWDGAQVRDMPPCPGPEYQFDYGLKSWVWDAEIALIQVRARRDALLAQSDWRVIKAQESGGLLSPAWAAYRQGLRDITEQSDLQNIQWPQVPE